MGQQYHRSIKHHRRGPHATDVRSMGQLDSNRWRRRKIDVTLSILLCLPPLLHTPLLRCICTRSLRSLTHHGTSAKLQQRGGACGGEEELAAVRLASCARLVCSPRQLVSPARLACSPRLLASPARLAYSPHVLASPARFACSPPGRLACSPRLLTSPARLVCSPRLLASCARLACSTRQLISPARLACSPRLLASYARLACSLRLLASWLPRYSPRPLASPARLSRLAYSPLSPCLLASRLLASPAHRPSPHDCSPRLLISPARLACSPRPPHRSPRQLGRPARLIYPLPCLLFSARCLVLSSACSHRDPTSPLIYDFLP